MNRFPSKANSVAHLKSFLNDEIKTVIDVGILTSTIELMRTFRDEKHVLIEPLTEYFALIEENYTKANIDFDLLKIAASNRAGSQKLRKINHLPELGDKYGGVSASNLVFEESPNEDGLIEVRTDRLDNIKENYNGPFLVKIDVDGAEFQILEGLTDCDDVFVVILESYLSRIPKFISSMNEKGFSLFDITDLCHMRGQLSQVDLIFINKKLQNNERYKEITPRNFGFTPAQSGNYVPFKEELILKGEYTSDISFIQRKGELQK
ncbi:FkbM family methyltransferase [Luminiphilus sp.]|nr:FkbM family methyltransferase [Luminiphilus sp.]MDA9710864.1 FkbM family methyltransferase [Luminiphilus sp.]